MKRILLSLLALLVASPAFAQAATATATMSFGTAGNPATVEYFIEQKAANGTWTEVLKGPTSPLVYTMANPGAGTVVTLRVRARLPGNAASASGPSNEATATVPANTPVNFTVVFTFPPSP